MVHQVQFHQLDIFLVVVEVEQDIQEVMVLEGLTQMVVVVEVVQEHPQEVLEQQTLVEAVVVQKVEMVLQLMGEVDL